VRQWCGCGRTFRTFKKLVNHLVGKRLSLHVGWPGSIIDGIPIGGARRVIDDEKPEDQLVPGLSVPLIWYHADQPKPTA